MYTWPGLGEGGRLVLEGNEEKERNYILQGKLRDHENEEVTALLL